MMGKPLPTREMSNSMMEGASQITSADEIEPRVAGRLGAGRELLTDDVAAASGRGRP